MQMNVPQRLNLLLMHAEDLNEEEIQLTIKYMGELWQARFKGEKEKQNELQELRGKDSRIQ